MKHRAVPRALATGVLALSCSLAAAAERWEAGKIDNRACRVPPPGASSHELVILMLEQWPQDVTSAEGPVLDDLRTCAVGTITYSVRADLPEAQGKSDELQKILTSLRPVTSPAFRTRTDCLTHVDRWAKEHGRTAATSVQIHENGRACTAVFEDGTVLLVRRVTVAPDPFVEKEQRPSEVRDVPTSG